jgi:hypothetical protein
MHHAMHPFYKSRQGNGISLIAKLQVSMSNGAAVVLGCGAISH